MAYTEQELRNGIRTVIIPVSEVLALRGGLAEGETIATYGVGSDYSDDDYGIAEHIHIHIKIPEGKQE